jgi:hypothetical protein
VLDALNRHIRQAQGEEFDELFDTVHRDSASSDALRRHTFVLVAWWSSMELLFHELKNGSLPKQLETLRLRARTSFAAARANEVWYELRGYYTRDFQAHVDQIRSGEQVSIDRVRDARQCESERTNSSSCTPENTIRHWVPWRTRGNSSQTMMTWYTLQR